MEHIVTDHGSNRTFCLTVEGGALVCLHEEIKHPLTGIQWVDVDKLDPNGAEWWEQWEGEVKAGQFGAEYDDRVEEAHFNRQRRLALRREY